MGERSAAGGSRGGTMQAEVLLPSRDLHADLSFYGERLGFRLESIFPADNPAVAVMTGHGLRIRLVRGADDAPGTLILLCDRPEAFAAGASELESPGGTRIEIRAREPEFTQPGIRHALVVQRMEEGESWVVGRAGMQYRDLIPGRLGGAVIASHIRIPEGGPVPDMVHFHTVTFQLIYCYRGWFNLVYEDQGPPFRLEAGDCVIQPPEIRHRVLESSDNAEVIELGVPAEHPTSIDHELTLPTDALNSQRIFGGQRFCRHRRCDATWKAWRLPGFEARRTGVAEATGGVANVEVARAANEATRVVTSHDADILFTFVLEGGMSLRAPGRETQDLAVGDAFVVPPRTRIAYERCSADLELLEVSLPGVFETTVHDEHMECRPGNALVIEEGVRATQASTKPMDSRLRGNDGTSACDVIPAQEGIHGPHTTPVRDDGKPMTDFNRTRALFHLPEGVVYMDGNSLGPLPIAARERVARLLSEEWAEMLIRGWNDAGWMDQPSRIGDRIGRLIGAPPGTVVMGDTLSIKVYQAVAAALEIRPDRGVILSDHGNFPSDLYMADGLIRSLGRGHEMRLVAPEDVAGALDENVAVLMLTEIDYRTGRKHDMARLTAAAHAAGALTVWDLAHSAGALPVDLAGARADFAVGCTYKYLNAGPGAPAFIYVAPDHIDHIRPVLAGWLGHASPFAFDLDYRSGPGIERMRVGTPPIIAFAALDAALDVWDEVSIHDVRTRSMELSELFIAEVEMRCPELELVSPRSAGDRGSQVSFRFEHAYPAMQALIDRGVVGDFRAPDAMRFGIAPLYLDADDMVRAAETLGEIVAGRLWDRPRHREWWAVT